MTDPSATEDTEIEYLEITPTADRLDPRTVTSEFRRLQQLRVPNEAESWFTRVVSGSPDPPVIEWLLVTDGTADGPLTYCVGVSDPSVLDLLETICQVLFPKAYEIDRLHTHPLSVLPGVTSDDDGLSIETEDDDPAVAAVTYLGRAERRRDWQTHLTQFGAFTEDEETALPLTRLVETLVKSDVPMAFQTLLRPKREWTDEAVKRRIDLELGQDTPASRIVNSIFGSEADVDDTEPTGDVALRLADLDSRDARRSFIVNARVVGVDPEPPTDPAGAPESRTDLEATLSELTSAFAPLNGEFHRIEPTMSTGDAARAVLEALLDREPAPQQYDRLVTKLPLVANRSPGIVADVTEAPGFCLLDGTAHTALAERGLAPTPGERSSLTRPPDDILSTYRTEGFALGRPINTDRNATPERLSLPPSLQPLHLAWFGKTGSGKSTSLVSAILDNQAATDGADILIDPKGDGMAEEYLRAHYATYGSLEDVYYFDCTEVLPAISFFDIRHQLESGIDRTTAVEDVVDHYIEILQGIMGRDRFERAVRSPDIIRFLCKALFDPVHGSDAFTHHELQAAATHMHESRDPLPVTDHELQSMLTGLVSNNTRSLNELMHGVANRIEKIPLDARLGALFNYVPRGDDPHFDLYNLLDENAVILVDTGGLRPESKRAITLVLLSALWTALRRRTQDREGDNELPLVNLYLEEAAEIANSGLLSTLLAQSRSFGLSMTLAMQFPGQLAQSDHNAYAELLNNVSTIVTGNVAVDSRLPERLATDDMPPAAVGRRLGALSRGEWMVSLPAEFGKPEPRPFLLESLPLPAGHPESDAPLSRPRKDAFETSREIVTRNTIETVGIPTASVGPDSTTHTADFVESLRIDSALPYTQRLPEAVTYNGDIHLLECATCERRYKPTILGMQHTIDCCHDLEDVNRDDVPICELTLNLTENEFKASPYSPAQLRFLQAVYSAHQQQFTLDLEYDILQDSMVLLQEYVGIDRTEIQALLEDDLLRRDCTWPHSLYTVTAEGRDVINAQYREGIAYGPEKGDLGESSLHVAMVELGRRYLEQAYVDDPATSAVSTTAYYEPPNGNGRLDAVALDEANEVVVALEAELSNHDTVRAVPHDFDKMAACDPEEAIWIVKNRTGAAEVLSALYEPKVGEPRIDRTYSENTAPVEYNIDSPGFTELRTFQSLLEEVLSA